PDFAFDPLKFIQVLDRFPVECDGQSTFDGECFRVAKTEPARTIAHDELLAVESETPPFAFVTPLCERLKSFGIVNESALVLPRKLNQLSVCQRDAFAENIMRKFMAQKYFSAF